MKKKLEISMEVIHAHAAGIDIGSKSHWVAVDQNPQHVREFGVYTKDHLELIEYLRSFQINTVAWSLPGLIGKHYLTHFSPQDSMLFSLKAVIRKMLVEKRRIYWIACGFKSYIPLDY